MSDSSFRSEREERLDQILADYLEAQRQGRAPRHDELLAQHPEFAAELVAFLDDQAALLRVAPPAEQAVTIDTIKQAAVPDTSPPVAPAPGTRIGTCGDYELLAEIARGGMGVVYKARQVSLNRLVALKMILSGQLASTKEIERFRAEAEAAASLDHPHVLPIYEVGECEGHQYFSMKLVEGGSLSGFLAGTPLRELADVLVKVCRAVHFAHQRGILHRDLKPGNILLARGGREPTVSTGSGGSWGPRAEVMPFVTDFGLAKRVEGDSQLTQSGAVVGTPSYMPPEQARGVRKLTTAADVYSLGAILYEMLTGRPPFRGESPLDTLLQVLEREPVRPRSLRPQTDADLETICLKCLEKDPQRRYGSAEALADDLQRWRDGVPILARPTSGTERVVKWAKRRPAIAALLTALVWTLTVGVGGILWNWRHAVIAEKAAVAAEQVANSRAETERLAREQERLARLHEAEARKAAEKAQKEEALARKTAEKAQKSEALARTAADEARKKETRAKEDAQKAQKEEAGARARADGLRLAAEADAARFRDPGLALLLVIEGAQRSPSHLTFSSLYGALNACREVHCLGDGGRHDRGWDIYAGDVKLARYLDGKRILSMAGASLRTHHSADGKLLSEWPGYNLRLTGAALDPAGRRVVLTSQGSALVRHSDGVTYQYTDRLAYVVDLTTGKELLRLRGAQNTVVSAEFSLDGQRILTASWDGAARIHDAATGKLIHTLKPPSKKSLLLARFTPDGKHVVTVTTNDGRTTLSYQDGDKKTPADPDFDPAFRPLGPTNHGEGSFGSNLVADATIAHVWDAATGKQVAACSKGKPSLLTFGHAWYPQAADVAPDSTTVAIALEGVVPVYETKTGKHRFDLTGHEGTVHAVVFSPDGKLIATTGADQTVRLWDATTGKETLRLRNHTSNVIGTRFDRTGKLLVSWSSDATARVWETGSGIEKAVLRGHSSLNAADFSPDGKAVVTAGDNTVRVWSLEAPKMPDTRLDGHRARATALAYSPDGKLAVTVSQDGTARLWETATGKAVRVFGEGRELGEVRMARFSFDGKRLVTASSNRQAQGGDKDTTSAVLVWDVATGKELLALKELETGALGAFFSPDGKQVLTVGDGYVRVKQTGSFTFNFSSGSSADAGRLQLWDAATGKLLTTVPGKKDGMWNSNNVLVPVFSPDGKRLLTYDENEQMPKVLDTLTGKVLVVLRGSKGWGKPQFLFSPDAKRVLFTRGGDIFIHDTGTGAQLGRLYDLPGPTRHFALSGDGKRLVAAAGKFAIVWDLETRKTLAKLRGHESAVVSVAFSSDGSRVLTGAADQTAGLWDVASGKMLGLYRGHTDTVTQVAFHPDGKQVATVSADGTARLWPTDLWLAVRARKTRDLTGQERDRYDLPPVPGTNRPVETEPKFDPASPSP